MWTTQNLPLAPHKTFKIGCDMLKLIQTLGTSIKSDVEESNHMQSKEHRIKGRGRTLIKNVTSNIRAIDKFCWKDGREIYKTSMIHTRKQQYYEGPPHNNVHKWVH